MTRENCKGFQVYESSYFYSKHGGGDVFKKNPKKAQEIYNKLENATLIHMFNSFTRGNKILVGKKTQTYAFLAELYCPRVYNSLAHYF